jgi:NADH:ubiquinone oxidoreductase subunit
MDLGILLFTWWKGQLVGIDEFGNRYYQERKQKKYHKAKRWVLYKGKAEASKVPAYWHGWLHYTFDSIPSQTQLYEWQKGHLPNLTGTTLAHHPDKLSPLYPQATKLNAPNYEPWKP